MPGSVTIYLVLISLAVFGGATRAYLRERRPVRATVVGEPQEDRSGWVYFITAAKRHDTPVKVGMSKYEPSAGRLPDLKTMSPFPLRVIHKVKCVDRYATEAAVHEHLKDHRLHGEWFDRDATMMYIAHLKGEV